MRVSRLHIDFSALKACSLVFLVATFTILSAGSAMAQTDWWSPVDGPYGGTTVWDLERTPDGAILAATSNGVHRSIDEGRTWAGLSVGLTTFDVRDIHVDSQGDVRVATFGHGLFKLSPVQDVWTSDGLDNTYTTSLLEPEPGILLAGANGFVYRSDDQGASWSARSLEGYSVNVQSLAANGDYVFAASHLGIFRSDNDGLDWEFASFGLQEYNVSTIATNELGHVFAGMQPGQGGCSIYRSRGNGSLWTCVQPQTDPLTVPMIKAAPDGTLFAGGFRNLYQSSDEGGTWLSRRASGSNVQSMLFLGSGMLIGTHGQGVMRSEDNGVSWVESNDGLQSSITTVRSLPDGRVVAGTSGGLFVTGDLGSSWSRIHQDLPLIQSITDVIVDGEGSLLAATTAGVWKHDDTDGWNALGPPGMPAIRDLDVSEDGTVLAGYYAGVWLHAGSGWVNSPITGPDMAARDVAAVHVASDGSLLAGASWDSWRRAAGESVWQLMSSSDLAWFDVQAFGESENRLLAGTKFSGVLQSFDYGETWFPMGTGLQGSEDIRDIQFDSRGTPYIATYGSGVYQLNPWSNSWLPVRSGLDGHWRITSMTYDTYGNAWIGTVDGGLFRHGAAGVGTESDNDLPSGFDLGAPWPNPSTGSVRVTVSLDLASEIQIDVSDMLGRQVHTDRKMLSAGSHELPLDLGTVPSGVYWIRATTDRGTTARPVSIVR